MGSLETFDPTEAVNYWFAKKKRVPKHNIKSHQQDWFNGVFNEATNKKNIISQPLIKF